MLHTKFQAPESSSSEEEDFYGKYISFLNPRPTPPQGHFGFKGHHLNKLGRGPLGNATSILFYPITLEGRRGTTDEFATTPFHLDLFSAALVELAKSIPVHSLILSSHLFFCLPLFLFPFTVPCRIVFAKPEDLETWPNHLSFRFLTRVRSSSYSPMAAWIFLRTSSLVTWSLYEMFNSLR